MDVASKRTSPGGMLAAGVVGVALLMAMALLFC